MSCCEPPPKKIIGLNSYTAILKKKSNSNRKCFQLARFQTDQSASSEEKEAELQAEFSQDKKKRGLSSCLCQHGCCSVVSQHFLSRRRAKNDPRHFSLPPPLLLSLNFHLLALPHCLDPFTAELMQTPCSHSRPCPDGGPCLEYGGTYMCTCQTGVLDALDDKDLYPYGKGLTHQQQPNSTQTHVCRVPSQLRYLTQPC